MMRFDARVAVLKRLEELGLYKGKEKNEMVMKICSRSGDIIEPFVCLVVLIINIVVNIIIIHCHCHHHHHPLSSNPTLDVSSVVRRHD